MKTRIAEARRFLGGVVVDGFFNGISRVARLHPGAHPKRHAVEHLRDIRYQEGTMREHLLDVYRPVQFWDVFTVTLPTPAGLVPVESV